MCISQLQLEAMIRCHVLTLYSCLDTVFTGSSSYFKFNLLVLLVEYSLAATSSTTGTIQYLDFKLKLLSLRYSSRISYTSTTVTDTTILSFRNSTSSSTS
jgi:hypothetical protein